MSVKTATGLVVKDVMTREPIAVDPTISARELARILTENNISGVPVVDVQDRVIGVVSKTDLLQWCVTGGLGYGAENLLQTLSIRRDGKRAESEDLGIVEDFMATEPILATEDEPVDAIAKRMAEERVHRVIVVDADGCLTGIVTSLDLLKVFPNSTSRCCAR